MTSNPAGQVGPEAGGGGSEAGLTKEGVDVEHEARRRVTINRRGGMRIDIGYADDISLSILRDIVYVQCCESKRAVTGCACMFSTERMMERNIYCTCIVQVLLWSLHLTRRIDCYA